MDMLFWLPQAAPEGTSTSQPPKGQEGTEPAAPPPSGNPMVSMFPFIILFVIMYFLLIKPQRKQAKEREGMIANLKKDDHVLTSGGIYGIVKQVKPEDPDLILSIDEKQDVRIRISKSAIAGLVKSSGAEGKASPEPEKAKS